MEHTTLKIEPLQYRFPREEFDYQTLLNVLKAYSRPRDKITDLIRKGIIIRVKKGLYVLGDRFRMRPYSRELLANLVYGPSYISMEYALQYYGMIPERVEAVTSVTTGRSRRFITPLGLFIYRNIPLSAFHVGMTRIEYDDNTAFLFATPEKALCDKIRNDQNAGLRSLKDMRHYLIEGLRIDEASLSNLNPDYIDEVARHYGSAKLRLLHRSISRMKE
jgi:predicted transcriptional regulator of viral defense system